MTAQEFLAGSIERMAGMLAFALSTTQEERLTWAPEIEGNSGRCALAQAQECIGANRRIAAALRGQTAEPPAEPDLSVPLVEVQTRLRKSARDLADLVRGLDDEAFFERTIPTPFGRTVSFGRLAEIGCSNMVYHVGQINYI